MTPIAFAGLRPECVGAGDGGHRGRRALPCDVARDLERGAADIAVLARYAAALDADVIALQEVDGAPAADQLFPGYHFCFTGSPALQNTGFAIRPGLAYRCETDLSALSLGGRVRRGALLTLFPGEARELRLLGVHLKSGCARQPLSGPQAACRELARQAPVLHEWIAAQAAAGRSYAVLGDFNRELLGAHGADELWAELVAGLDPYYAPHNAAAGAAFVDCTRGQAHHGYIDHILLGGPLAAQLLVGSFRHDPYRLRDAVRYKLSDHCPVSVRLRLQ